MLWYVGLLARGHRLILTGDDLPSKENTMDIALLIIVVAAIAAYYGLFDTVETAARMGNRRIEMLETEQIQDEIKFYNKTSIDADQYEKAVTQKELIRSFRNL